MIPPDHIDPEGCHWDDAVSYVQGYTLGFCWCGDPEENLRYVRKALTTKKHNAFNEDYEALPRVESPADGFFYYWADKKGFTEHDGCIPRWLTEKGKELLDDIDKALAVHPSTPFTTDEQPGGVNG